MCEDNGSKNGAIYKFGEIIDKFPFQFLAFMFIVGGIAVVFAGDDWKLCGERILFALFWSCVVPPPIKAMTKSRFPSLHTTVAVSLCIIASYHIPPFIPVGIILIVFTGAGRVYLERHVWADVLGGIFLGIIIAALTIGGVR